MIDGAFAVAFTAGMLATVNPCGFAMLPAYLLFFLGLEGAESDARAGMSRALAVGLAVSAGFAATFAVIGFVVIHLTREVYEWGPWVSVVIGVTLAALGVGLLAGWEPRIATPRLDAGGRTRGALSMFVFGVSYAIVSLGCTLTLFAPQVAFTFRDGGLLSGLVYFLAYAAGFAVLLTALTVTLALAQRSLVAALRRLLPHIQRISGGLLVVAGAYVAWYGWYEIDRLGEEDPIVERVTGWSDDAAAWIQERGATTLGLVLALVIGAAALFVASRARRAR